MWAGTLAVHNAGLQHKTGGLPRSLIKSTKVEVWS